MKCLITGGAGFIGSHLVNRLIKEGHKVVVIDNLSTGKKENLNPKAKFYKVDIKSSKISQIFKKERFEIVFHYAAQISVRKSIKNSLQDAKINILGSLNVLENCKKFSVKKVIFPSTGAVYGNAEVLPTPEDYPELPLSPYAISKLTIEKYLNYYYKNFNLLFLSLRLANVYGPRQNPQGEAGVIAIFLKKMLSKDQPIIYGDGMQTRDFIFINDVVEANILALKSNKVGIFNIGTSKETNVKTIFKKLKELTNSKCTEVHGPPLPYEQKRSCLDYSKAKKILGWRPKYNLNEGLTITMKWFRENSDIYF
jgi:UDP-glucose 4-epimerase